MPRPLQILLSGSAFLVFIVGTACISWLVIPLLSLSFDPEVRRRRCERVARFATRVFVRYPALLGLIEIRWPPLPADFPSGAYVMLANHPTLIDVTVIMARFPELSTVVSRKWFDRRSLGGMLKAAGYVPGPARDEEEGTRTLDVMVETLRAGTGMIIFPEGTRSDPGRVLRFRRGAVEAAIQAEVPIVPVFIHVNQPMLMRHQRWYEVPYGKGIYTLEIWPTIPTAGRDLDARELNAELAERFRARFNKMLAERAASPALPPAPADEPSRG